MSYHKDQTNKGSVIYEEVLHKNFQVMETFLKRFHQIFTKHDQFEQNLTKIAQKLIQHQEEMEQIKSDQKLGFLMMQKKMTNMKNSARQSMRMSRSSRMNINFNQQSSSHHNQKEVITQLKFDSISKTESVSQATNIISSQQMQEKNKLVSAMTEQIENLKSQILNLKDKTTFLSSYTSILSDKIDTQKSESMKQSLLANLQNNIIKKQQNQIKAKINQKQNSFLQFITTELDHISKKIYVKIEDQFTKNDKKINTKIQSFVKRDILQKQLNQNKQRFTKLAEQCFQIFAKKVQMKKSIQIIDKKLIKLNYYINYNSQQTTQNNKQTRSALQSPFVSQHNSQSKLRKSKMDCSNKFNRRKSLKCGKDSEDQTQFKKVNSNKQNQKFDFSKQYLLANHVSKQFTKCLGYPIKKLNKSGLVKDKSIQTQAPLCKSTLYQQASLK